MIYHIEVQLDREAKDHSQITMIATELSVILSQAGYDHVATIVLDDDGETVAEFGLPS